MIDRRSFLATALIPNLGSSPNSGEVQRTSTDLPFFVLRGLWRCAVLELVIGPAVYRENGP
jgi:hypothetical protein